jgi:epoxyqueuosine reductase
MKPKLLLHVCCATCGAYVLELLKNDYQVTAYYYNPNIYPVEEYEKRFLEIQKYCQKNQIPFIEEKPDQDEWFAKIKGFEQEPERGKRCWLCYDMRLAKTAEYAKNHGFQFFGTDLSISPHKDAKKLNEIGKKLEKTFGLKYFEADFKKADGFKKAMAVSRQNEFYRQDYCGCIYSRQNRQQT